MKLTSLFAYNLFQNFKKNIKYLFLIINFVCSFFVKAESSLPYHLKDAQTGDAVPFANILFGSTQNGTVSDINGLFYIPENQKADELRISCMGYETVTVYATDLSSVKIILLDPLSYELDQVTILPEENPAMRIMKKVIENRYENNPEETTNYSCIIYHKMTFGMDIPEPVDKSDESLNKLWEFNRDNYFLLIESVSKRKHQAPSITNEEIISGRVSGFEQPTLSILPSQLQPFTFNNDYITLLNNDLLNPASRQGLRSYLFLLEDILIDNLGDTIYYITFEPRKNMRIKGMKGSFHIHQPTFAIKTVTASTLKQLSPFTLHLRQNYQFINNEMWFPEQMETRLEMNIKELSFPLVGEGKSMVTGIDINPDFSRNDFKGPEFIDKSSASNSHLVEMYRYRPLNARDSATYHLIDSLGQQYKFDRLVDFQKSLISGHIPMGYLNLNINKLLAYNRYEGFKLGIGLQSSEYLSKVFSTEGYYSRSFASRSNNYGGGIQLNFNPINETNFKLFAENSLITTGDFYFLDGYELTSDERYKHFMVKILDPTIQFHSSLSSRIFAGIKAQVSYRYKEVEPILRYPYLLEDKTAPDYHMHSAELRLKWQPFLKLSYTGFGLMPLEGVMPSMWFNLSAVRGESDTPFSFLQAETQFEHQYRITPVINGGLRFTAGHIWGEPLFPHLYSAFGSYSPTLGLESRYSFATMRANEFAAGTFALLFLRTTIPTRINKRGYFKPEISFSSSAGWSSLSSNFSNQINTFNKGYYESGIYIGNLLSQLFIKYGIGVHYRYGPYRMKKEIDNWSFKIGIEFNL